MRRPGAVFARLRPAANARGHSTSACAAPGLLRELQQVLPIPRRQLTIAIRGVDDVTREAPFVRFELLDAGDHDLDQPDHAHPWQRFESWYSGHHSEVTQGAVLSRPL